MSHHITITPSASKATQYEELLPQIASVIADESDWIAIWANTAAMLHDAFDHFWIGFYRVVGAQLVVAPFQGPVCCMRIDYGRGVCGTAWKEQRTIVVPNVEKFPGHIACSSLSRSEIVVPLMYDGQMVALLDIDSTELNAFDETDAYYLEQLMQMLAHLPVPQSES